MNKKLFMEINNQVMESGLKRMELRQSKRKENELKTQFLSEMIEEATTKGTTFRGLLYEFAVDKNHGMDICIENLTYEELESYIIEYAKEVYCMNLEGIDSEDEKLF